MSASELGLSYTFHSLVVLRSAFFDKKLSIDKLLPGGGGGGGEGVLNKVLYGEATYFGKSCSSFHVVLNK